MPNVKRKVLVAPEYAMADLAESHRMASISKAFLDMGHEVVVLGRGRYDYFFSDESYWYEEIPFDYKWMDAKKFHAIHNDMDGRGLSFFNKKDLERFVSEEVKLLNRIRPDVVITGFRPSISISTKVARVPLVWVLSAVVSDMYIEAGLHRLPHGMERPYKLISILPAKLRVPLIRLFTMKRMKVFNMFMRRHSMSGFRSFLEVVRGDFNVMSDAPELFPEFGSLPPYYTFCGPLLIDHFAIQAPRSMLNYVKGDRPAVFFSMGSSGDPRLFIDIVQSLDGRPYDVFVAGTSIITKNDLDLKHSNVIVEQFFPPRQLSEIVDLSVIHGGQGTVYTTLMAGTPFVGIPMFHEQQWNLENLVRKGCGLVLSKKRVSPKSIQESIDEILGNSEYKKRAQEVQQQISKYETDKAFYPPLIAAEKILEYLEGDRMSYFDLKPDAVTVTQGL